MEISDTPINTHAEIAPVLNNKKKNNFYNKNKNSRNKEKSYQNPRYFENSIPEEENSTESISSLLSGYNELFYFLRQKYSYNTKEFFECLMKNLATTDFKSIKTNDMSLFSYACLYEKNEIFTILFQNYSHFLEQTDFENYIIPLCLNKNIPLLKLVKQIFEEKFQFTPEFTNHLLLVMSKGSYRDDNNHLVLQWLETKITPEQINNFFTSVLQHKNVSLLNCSIKHDIFKSYLKDNFLQFELLLDKIGRKIDIKNQLNQDTHYYNKDENPILLSNFKINFSVPSSQNENTQTYLSNKEEQLKSVNNKLILPTIVVRKKRKILA